MKIWLLEDGERTGPHEIFTVRDRISSGEVNADTPAWYEGADGWLTLADVPAYSSDFSQAKSESDKPNDRNEGIRDEDVSDFVKQLENNLREGLNPNRAKPNSAEFQNEPLNPVRRFFARFLDIALYSIVVFLIKLQMGLNPLEVSNVAKELFYQLPYLLIDGLAMTYLGTTPGKWLLDIKLRNASGQKLELGSSIIRSARVWVLGFAMQTWLVIVSIPFSWFAGAKYGKFIWDIPQNNITEYKPINPLKIVIYVGVVIGTGMLLQMLTPPEYLPSLENYKLYNSL